MPAVADALNMIAPLRHMNLEVLHDSCHCLRVRMPLEGNTNHFGTQYAGAIFSLAEFPFGLMFAARFGLKEMLPVIGEMQIRYLMPSPLPLEVELRVEESEWRQLEKETREKGRARLVRDIDVVDADGRVHARATATYFSLLRESRG